MQDRSQNRIALLSAEGVGKHIDGPSGRLDILNDVSLEVNTGETVAISTTRQNHMHDGSRNRIALLSTAGVGKYVEGPSGRLDILNDVSLEVNAGETVAITGASGSGKTTLLGLLAGLDLPSRGSVRLDGQKLETLDEETRARLRLRNVGFVFQSF
ncbi:MAG TPA: ATP-binding cassette domain-containing protein, partial [Rhodanobacteraceae bacterium]|nr:ATP-binding cassette domain-containing protein [Rhodanobacteraceae bacterium]